MTLNVYLTATILFWFMHKIKKIGDRNAVENLTARLFGNRRKMIRGIMRDVDWTAFGLTGTERAEELNPEKFLEIAKKLVA